MTPTGNDHTRSVPRTFDSPEKIPSSKDEAQEWQHANRSFWESTPMRYDWKEDVEHTEGSKEFFEEIDRRFYGNVRPFMPWTRIPFDNLIPFEDLKHKSVLEIGVGMGSHASLLAAHALSYTGIDLTDYAVKMTTARMKLLERDADIRRMDAEAMEFPDSTFDFIWSWGVIHHSSNTRRILQEMHRVLKSGGQAVIMVYNRGWWNYYICGGLINGLLRGGIFKFGSLAKAIQANTDGALARYYSAQSWTILASEYFDVNHVVVAGPKTDVFPIPGGRFKKALMRLIPDWATRFLTNQCRMGGFLISKLVKH
ncbi:MAG: class I SAM-dependent methyltransferase [Proteobacteria bacterium]|nr:class I SAM-dependent methyltransferase [Pseudomonadota bacterium]